MSRPLSCDYLAVRKRLSIVIVTLVIFLVGCATDGNSEPRPEDYLRPFSADTYAISPTDLLQIDIYREQDLSGQYYVDPSGTINFPLLGRVAVSGSTAQQIELNLESRLSRGYLVDPDVRITVVKYRPIYISGQVAKPGEYAFAPGMTVQQAITLAGGPTRFAAERYYLQRYSERDSEQKRVTGNSLLFPGDLITIGERIF